MEWQERARDATGIGLGDGHSCWRGEVTGLRTEPSAWQRAWGREGYRIGRRTQVWVWERGGAPDWAEGMAAGVGAKPDKAAGVGARCDRAADRAKEMAAGTRKQVMEASLRRCETTTVTAMGGCRVTDARPVTHR